MATNKRAGPARRAVVLHWSHDLLSSPEVARDTARIMERLGRGDSTGLELESGPPQYFRIVLIDDKRRTSHKRVPTDWSGVVPGSLYNLLVNSDADFYLDPQYLPLSDDAKTFRRGLARWMQRKRPQRSSGPRLNFDFMLQDNGCFHASLEAPNAVDYIGQAGQYEISPGVLPLVIGWPGTLGEIWPAASAGAFEALAEVAFFSETLQYLDRGEVNAALALCESKLGLRRRSVTLRTQRPLWEVLRQHEGDESALFAAETRFGIACNSVEELDSHAHFQREMAQPLAIDVLMGWLGYMWRDLVLDIAASMYPHLCAHCGSRSTAGRRDARFCSWDDNPDCCRERNRIRKRQSRAAT